MGLLSLNLPVIGQSSATEDQKVRDALSTIQTDYNGNISDANIAATAGIQQSKLANGATGLGIGAFSATLSAAPGAATLGTAVIFGAEEWDVSNWYDNTTGRWSPQVAGYYRVSASLNFTPGATQWVALDLYKSGTVISKTIDVKHSSLGVGMTVSGSADFQMNGTTDYITVGWRSSVATAPATGIANSFFQGEMIGRS
jgi:hypothetical protein